MTKDKMVKIAILIPTYNNISELKSLCSALESQELFILFINDGSKDGTKEFLKEWIIGKNAAYIEHDVNQGKGIALRNGFKYLEEKGFSHAISMDSDGQHLPKDIKLFIEKIKEDPEAIWIGARNLNQNNVPMKSSFGNRFSNFWVWAQTGVKIPDSQSGFRAYPIKSVQKIDYKTQRFEFEIEVLIRNQWRDVPLKYFDIDVYYPPEEERISHFRPFKDFMRIFYLNTVLTLIALFWIFPKRFIYKIFKIKTWKSLYQQTFYNPKDSFLKKKLSLSFGVFMGIVPVWGFQLLIGIPLAVLLKLNKGLFLIGANISIFPLTPLWWVLSLKLGQLLLGLERFPIVWKEWDLDAFKNMGLSFFLGGAVLAIFMALLTFILLSFKNSRSTNFAQEVD